MRQGQPTHQRVITSTRPEDSNGRTWLPLLWLGSVLIPALVASSIYLGPAITLLFGISLVGGLVCPSVTRTTRSDLRVVRWQILTIVGLLALAWQLWSGNVASGLASELPKWFATPIDSIDDRLFYAYPLGLTVLLLLGAAATHTRRPLGEEGAWFTFSLGVAMPTGTIVGLLATSSSHVSWLLLSCATLITLALVGMSKTQHLAGAGATP